MKNFDLFIGVDWSGSKQSNTKSIALSVAKQGEGAPELFPDIRSRTAVSDRIKLLAEQVRRCFIGVDCNFGLYHDFLNMSATEIWGYVEALNASNDNFFAGGFWSDPKLAEHFWTEGKMPEGFQMPKRQTEIICAENGYGRPESPFKLIGAKQVGKGGLAGMRMVHHLKSVLGDKIAIWPFEAHYDDAQIVVSEIYPRQFMMRVGHGTTKIRDVETLNEALKAFNSAEIPQDTAVTDHDTDAIISAAGLRYLCGSGKNIPQNLSNPPVMEDRAKFCEGWIFGVGDK